MQATHCQVNKHGSMVHEEDDSTRCSIDERDVQAYFTSKCYIQVTHT